MNLLSASVPLQQLRGDQDDVPKLRSQPPKPTGDPKAKNANGVLQAYEIKSKIGEGSCGEVFAAVHRLSGHQVAIKMVPCSLSHPFVAKTIYREVTILRQLGEMTREGCFPHAIQLLDIELWESCGELQVALIFKLEKVDLQAFMRMSQRRKTTAKQFKSIMYSLLCGLRFIHSAGIAHRDIKPSNLLLAKPWRVFLADFGLATVLPDQDESTVASPGSTASAGGKGRSPSPHVVTRSYRAPEVILKCPYDTKIDIWSAGTTLVELFNSLFSSLEGRECLLFQGTYCSTLSPLRGEKEEHDVDQLEVILEVLGAQTKKDLSFLESSKQQEQVAQYQQQYEKIDFRQEYDACDSSLVGLFNHMLAFNPALRASPGQLLKQPVFDEVRDPKMETKAPRRVQLEDVSFELPERELSDVIRKLLLKEKHLLKGSSII